MKKIVSVLFLNVLLFIICGCEIHEKQLPKFDFSIKEGRYQNEEQVVVNNQSYDACIRFEEASTMEYVKRGGRQMVEDLYTANEKFYTVHRIDMTITIDEVEYTILTNQMTCKSMDTKNEYLITMETNEINLEKAYFTLVNNDEDTVAEKAICELSFKTEKGEEQLIQFNLVNYDERHILTIIDEKKMTNYLENENTTSCQLSLLPGDVIYITIKNEFTKKMIVSLSTGEVIEVKYDKDFRGYRYILKMPEYDLTVEVTVRSMI